MLLKDPQAINPDDKTSIYIKTQINDENMNYGMMKLVW